MSTNNFIQIDKKDFIVSDCDADTGYGAKIGRGKTLDEAIDLAVKYQEENIVEYGIQFTKKSATANKKQVNQKK